MHYKSIVYVLGYVLMIIGVLMLLPVVTGLIYGEYFCTLIFLAVGAGSALVGFLLIKDKQQYEQILIDGLADGSLAMILPISTPPNALAHATGMIEQKDMVKTGIIMGVVGLAIGYAMLIFLGSHGLI